MFRFAPSNLARTLIHGSRLATINRQQCRFIEDISYSKDFKPTKLATEDEQIEDEQTRRMRAAAENVFSANGVIITAYSEYGFRLNDTVKTLGPIVLFPRCAFPWKIRCLEDINEDSLCIFSLVEPKIDTLILGTGDQPVTKEIAKTILEVTRKHKINIEILSTEMACTTFNFLNDQGRMVGAALVPPRVIAFNDDDWLATQARENKLFKIDKMELLNDLPAKPRYE